MTTRLDEVVAAKKEDEEYEPVNLNIEDINLQNDEIDNSTQSPSPSPGVGFGPMKKPKQNNKRQSSIIKGDNEDVPYALQSELKSFQCFAIG